VAGAQRRLVPSRAAFIMPTARLLVEGATARLFNGGPAQHLCGLTRTALVPRVGRPLPDICGRLARTGAGAGARLAMSGAGKGEGEPWGPSLELSGVEKLSVPHIKKALKSRGLSGTGKARELYERLVEALGGDPARCHPCPGPRAAVAPAAPAPAPVSGRGCAPPPPPPPSLPYSLDTPRPSSRTNRTRLVHPPVRRSLLARSDTAPHNAPASPCACGGSLPESAGTKRLPAAVAARQAAPAPTAPPAAPLPSGEIPKIQLDPFDVEDMGESELKVHPSTSAVLLSGAWMHRAPQLRMPRATLRCFSRSRGDLWRWLCARGERRKAPPRGASGGAPGGPHRTFGFPKPNQTKPSVSAPQTDSCGVPQDALAQRGISVEVKSVEDMRDQLILALEAEMEEEEVRARRARLVRGEGRGVSD